MNHSTHSDIIQFLNNNPNCLEKKLFAVFFFFLSKAFDTVHHEILLNELVHFGIRGIPLKLIENYITNRRQAVY